MARELGLTVVAEGIETEPVERMLRDAGCDIGQGWRYARAMKEDDLIQWLNRYVAEPV
jgi:sensor c-di-GMP phosphodiesterase-like protein